MRHRSILALLLALLLSAAASQTARPSAQAQPSGIQAQPASIDEYIRAEMERQHVPGLSLAIVRDGKVVKAEGYGVANIEHDIPVRPETVFKIGSVSKQFIAVGVLLLVQDGKLSLDDPVSKYFTDAPETWRGITIRHLILHTSGLRREAPGFDPFKIQADADLIRTAYSSPLIFATGTKWEYCNLGYFMLAEIIRRVSGEGWDSFLTSRVFAPLGMKATRTTTLEEIVRGRAAGYVWRNERMRNADEFRALRPSGAFLSTVLDLAKWDAALYGDAILKKELREEMWKPSAETARKMEDGSSQFYGYGWFVAEPKGRREVFHGGSMPGFRAFYIRYLDDRLSIIVLTNGEGARPEPIARGVTALYLAQGRSAN